MKQCYHTFFILLRSAIRGEECKVELSADEWAILYGITRKQSLTGIIYTAVKKLKPEQQPPIELTMRWMAEAEAIRGLNKLQNQEAARLTRMFADKGRKTAILKGQANSRLYPDTLSRQPGDIDIWVEGGRKSVISLLSEMRLVVENGTTYSYHHVHLPANEQGVIVEVHYRPSSGNNNPFSNRRLQRWLEQEIEQTTEVEEGFRVPSIRFALVMQLSHIQRHFLSGGIGLRHVCDYMMLLRHSTEEDRHAVTGILKKFGLRHTALMWVLGEVMHLEAGLLLCEKDSYRGEWLLREIIEGGNFGKYAQRQQHGDIRRILENRWRNFKLMRYDFREMLWVEIKFWITVVRTLPTRIRYRTLSLNKVKK